jgi:hypothetical protein
LLIASPWTWHFISWHVEALAIWLVSAHRQKGGHDEFDENWARSIVEDEGDQETGSSSKSREGLELLRQNCSANTLRLPVFGLKPAMDGIEVEGVFGPRGIQCPTSSMEKYRLVEPRDRS